MERQLTRREHEVLSLVARGRTNREIAGALSLAESTVKVHMRNMCRLIGLRNRVELAIWRERNGPNQPMDETQFRGGFTG
ncbi:MAG: response regulator transcription factor [Alphaproteobacteria bacterium]